MLVFIPTEWFCRAILRFYLFPIFYLCVEVAITHRESALVRGTLTPVRCSHLNSIGV